eukprot:jgi/Chrzof1/6789/Cz19g09150.t1
MSAIVKASRPLALCPRHSQASCVWLRKLHVPYRRVGLASSSSAICTDCSFRSAFETLDRDGDGKLTEMEVYRLLVYYKALQQQPAPPSPTPVIKQPTWDLHLLTSIQQASQEERPIHHTLATYIAAKLMGRQQKQRPLLSDLVWSAAGMGVGTLLLGYMAMHVKHWPVVGRWHQQGLNLVLGSFGTVMILLFGRPEADAVRIWPLLAGQLGATAIAVSVLQLMGASVQSRAVAMAATMVYMLWTDCIHPPGGEWEIHLRVA